MLACPKSDLLACPKSDLLERQPTNGRAWLQLTQQKSPYFFPSCEIMKQITWRWSCYPVQMVAMFSVASAMKVMQELSTNSSEAAVTVHSVHLSRSENQLNGSKMMSVQNALVARASHSRTSVGENLNADLSSVDEELDAVVSAKFFGAIADGFSAAANTLASAGMSIGSAIGNAATVVGRHVVKAAETKFASLPGSIKNVANSIGNVAVGAVHAARDVGEMVADTTINLAGTVLHHAQRFAEAGARLAAGFASAVWNEMEKFINCLKQQLSLCSVLIGDQCDCHAGSHVELSPGSFSVRCVFQAAADFSKGFGVRAVPKNGMGGKTIGGIQIFMEGVVLLFGIVFSFLADHRNRKL